MAKQKKKPQAKKTTNTTKTIKSINKKQLHTLPLAPPTQPPQPKKKIADLSLFLKREESISPPTVQQKFSLQYFLRNTSIQLLSIQCPNLKLALDKIQNKISVDRSIDRNLLYSTVEKLLHGTKHQVWSDKYSPTNLEQSFSPQIGEKIKLWLRSFYSYRNTVFQQSNSFIDDYFGDQSNNTPFRTIKQNGWKLKGLILKGRQGVGKTTTIKITAKNMGYEILDCGNQCNQIKYLKQKNEATQSQCFNTKTSKNQTQIQKTNKKIATFTPKKQQKQIQNTTKRIQLMHDVGNFQPREDESKFLEELNKTIICSKIPFLMTVNGDDVPKKLKQYDVIEFQQGKLEDISFFLFLIFNIEKGLGNHLNLQMTVEKERFKQNLNEQICGFQFQIISPYSYFLRLTEIFNKKLNYLFTFFQNINNMSNLTNIQQAQEIMKYYLKRANTNTLINDYFYIQNSPHIQSQYTEESIQGIKISNYFIQRQPLPKETYLSAFDNKENDDQSLIKKNQKIEPNPNPKFQESSQESIFYKKQKCHTFDETLRKLEMKVLEDYNSRVQNDEYFIFNRLYNSLRQQTEEQMIQNIPIERHRQIRKKILGNVKKQFLAENQLHTSLKVKQLNLVGFLIDSRTRVSRNRVNNGEVNLKKLLKSNEINYLKTFTHFLKPNFMENKT